MEVAGPLGTPLGLVLLGIMRNQSCNLEKGMATHSSILAWRIPWTEEPGGLQSMAKRQEGAGSPWAQHPLPLPSPGSCPRGGAISSLAILTPEPARSRAKPDPCRSPISSPRRSFFNASPEQTLAMNS